MGIEEKKSSSIDEQMKAVYKWLVTNKDDIDEAGHGVLYMDMTHPDDETVAGAVLCTLPTEELAHIMYEIIKQRFQTGGLGGTLLKTHLQEFTSEIQNCYFSDYADTDSETMRDALDTIHTAVEEHADKFHKLFEDEDDSELAENVSRALDTLREVPEFFDFCCNSDDDDDDEDMEFPFEFEFDDEDDDEEEYLD